jgi:UDPglucose 6-dehydrogenase
LRTHLSEKRLSFTTDIASAVRHGEVIFLCLGTPSLPNGKPDLRSLHQAAETIAANLNEYKLIVEKSAFPIKTGEWLIQTFSERFSPGADFDVAAVPHFLREGKAVQDFLHPDRVVIGTDSQRAIDTLMKIYGSLNAPLCLTDISSAEIIKHATNAFLAMKISFINSIAQVCEKTGADIYDVAKGIGQDRRINAEYLNAGLGYGGLFLPKDIGSLINVAAEYHINLDLLKDTEVVNRYQRIQFIERIEHALGGLHGKTIAIWGLAYRPNTDDLRHAPSLQIIRGLQQREAKIRAYDPLAMEVARNQLRDVTYGADPYETAQDADAIAILTEWDEFSKIDFSRLKESSRCRVIVDGRNLYSPRRMRELGFHYYSIGRKYRPVLPEASTGQPSLLV